MRLLLPTLWMAACSADSHRVVDSAPALVPVQPAVGVLPPPGVLTLTTEAYLVGGVNSIVTVTGGQPGDTVRLVQSNSIGGAPYCHPSMAPACFALAAPVSVADKAVVDGLGAAVFLYTPANPPSAPQLQLQAVVLSQGGNADTSNAPVLDVFGTQQDLDGDGLTDTEELWSSGTDPLNPDTDGGGTADGIELLVDGTNPNDPGDDIADLSDADGDGLTDTEELVFFTDPADPDTDGDTVWDGAELLIYGTSPLADESKCMGWPGSHITTNADGARSIYATDLDADGDSDVLYASHSNKVGWYENLGGGTFVAKQILTSNADGAESVFATDLDGDGDPDVLAASHWDDKVAWFENLGGGSFGPEQIITTDAYGAYSIYATDLDGDGDSDVISASASLTDDKVAWYENLGGGSFGPQQIITNDAEGAFSVFATDLDGDGDPDVLSASFWDDKVAWYENLGGGSFGPTQIITTSADSASSVYATDLDGDGDPDVLSSSIDDDKVAWYENLGGGSFGPQQVITDRADGATSVYATDLDGDGDHDVLSTSLHDDKVAWYENLGGGSFGPRHVITNKANGAQLVFATDLDGDGDSDVLSASYYDDTVAWYENLGSGYDLDGDNLSAGAEECITGTDPVDSDTDGGGTDDGTEVNGLYDPFDPIDD